MISWLSGYKDSAKAYKNALNKEIKSLEIHSENWRDSLNITFVDNSKLELYDDGQSCCEQRYMSTDDDLDYYIGSTLLGAEIKEGPYIEDKYGEHHEQEFLIIKTSLGEFTIVNHNEHNGYYGGFSVKARYIESNEEDR